MIRSISYSNFKMLSGSTVRFGALTLLTGTNASGKSSIIQSILLARAATLSETGHVRLNDENGLNLGTAADVVSHGDVSAGMSNLVVLKIDVYGGECEFAFLAREDNRYLELQDPMQPLPQIGGNRSGDFTFLSPARYGAVDSEELPSVAAEYLRIGAKGEHTAAMLAAHAQFRVNPLLEHPTVPKLQLPKQAEAWLGEFVPQVRLRPQSDPELGRVGIRFRCEDMSLDWLKPANFGFGASYSLPIVVAGLLSNDRSLLIIDGPEGHLHPSGQSAMGQFLALVASTGAQVIVETHSDHVLNGVRLASLRGNAPPRDQIVINHVSRKDGFVVTPIEVTDRGELSQRPPEFFDQAEKDLAKIVRHRFPKGK